MTVTVRSQILAFLPTTTEKDALAKAETELMLNTIGHPEYGTISGFTVIDGCKGMWFPKPGIVVPDSISIAMIDVPDDQELVESIVKQIKSIAYAMYAKHGVPQQSIYVKVSKFDDYSDSEEAITERNETAGIEGDPARVAA